MEAPKGDYLIYLASPYSDPDPVVMHDRYLAVCRAAGWLMHKGFVVFSPIAHMHPIAVEVALPREWSFWERFDRVYLGHAEYMIILALSGWDKSTGIKAEIAIMQEQGKPVYLMWPDGYELTELIPGQLA